MYPVTAIEIRPDDHDDFPQRGATFLSAAELFAKINDESIADEVHALFLISERFAADVVLHLARELQSRGLWVSLPRSRHERASMADRKVAV